MRRSIATRNAARVLPEPVGARRSVEQPALIFGQPFACAGDGPGQDAYTHRCTRLCKPSSASACWASVLQGRAPLARSCSSGPPMVRSPLLPIFLTVFVDVLGLTMMLPLLPYYAEHFHASPF